MKIKQIWTSLLLLPLLFGCQSEELQDNTAAVKQYVVKASLPDSNRSRIQLTYGSQNEDEEPVMWVDRDWITVFNLSRLEECPFGLQLETVAENIHGNDAIFESHIGLTNDDRDQLTVKAGDVLLVTFGETLRKYDTDSINLDPRNIFTLVVGAEANKPQILKDIPKDESLKYMKDNLKMYDIVVADQDEVIPDIHFKHLSAIMRITLNNASGTDLFPTKLEFKYPNTNSFFNTTMYFSVNMDDHSLQIYDGDEFYKKGSTPYTDNIGTTVNAKDNTADKGGVIRNGESYELYLSAVPVLNNTSAGESLTISLIVTHDTDYPYNITLDGFDLPIVAGKRYWFDLTATPEGTLMLTNQWENLQKQQNNNSGEETEPES